MARRKGGLILCKTNVCDYLSVCWVSAEGTTECDYIGMAVLKDVLASVRFPKNTHLNRHNPSAVLRRFEKTLRENDFRASDEAWLVVDVDDWSEAEFAELPAWQKADSRHYLAVSNPKFELFLVMRFEKASGCTIPEKVDATLKKRWPRYVKRIFPTQFSAKQVHDALENTKARRASCKAVLCAPGMTDTYLLDERMAHWPRVGRLRIVCVQLRPGQRAHSSHF